MQPSQRLTTAMARAISSFVRAGTAPAAKALRWSRQNAPQVGPMAAPRDRLGACSSSRTSWWCVLTPPVNAIAAPLATGNVAPTGPHQVKPPEQGASGARAPRCVALIERSETERSRRRSEASSRSSVQSTTQACPEVPLANQIPLVDYLVLGDEPHLVAHECTSCGARYFDRRNACASCFATDFKEVTVP